MLSDRKCRKEKKTKEIKKKKNSAKQNKNETKQLGVARMSDDRRYHFCFYCEMLYKHRSIEYGGFT